jgi:hypothetical protein
MSMPDEPKAACFNYKGFTSFVLMIAFLALGLSGVLLYVGPHGPAARDWTFLGLGTRGWNHLHLTTAALFLLAALFHLVWNWSMFWGYIKRRAAAGLNLKLELLLALVIGVAVVAGTVYDVPPFSSIVEWKRALGNAWGSGEIGPPSGHGQDAGYGAGQGGQYHGGRP